LKHQYIHSKSYNNNENEVKSNRSSSTNIDGSSNRSVYVRLGLKAVSSLLIISFAIFITLYMDNLIFGLVSVFVAVVTVLFITGHWRWFYVAAVTAPRDIM
jgi:hypothetical protein